MSDTNKKLSAPSASSPDRLVMSWMRRAALAVMGASGLVILLLVTYMIRRSTGMAMYGMGVFWLAMFAASGALGGQLFRGRAWAQQALLAFWELLLIAGVWYLLTGVLFGQGTWWQEHAAMRSGIWVAAGVSVAAALITTLLILSSPAGSRLRYSSVVTSSVAIAIALAGAVNIISQHDYVDMSLETYGTHRLSERIKHVVADIDEPVVLTCVYNRGMADGRLYGPRTHEFLEQVADYARSHGRSFQVVNADTDSLIRRVDAQMNELIQSDAAAQIAFLTAFIEQGPELVSLIRAEEEKWNALPENTYLSLWFPGEFIAKRMDEMAVLLSQRIGDIRVEMTPTGGRNYPNYTALSGSAQEALVEAQFYLEMLGERLAEISRVPDEVSESQPLLMEQLIDLAEARQWVLVAVGEVGSDLPEDPAIAMKKFVEEASVVAERAGMVADLLDSLAGDSSMPGIEAMSVWGVDVEDSQGQKVRATLAERFRWVNKMLDDVAYQVGVMARSAKPEVLPQALANLRRQWQAFDAELVYLSRSVMGMVGRLTDVDPPSRSFLNRARAGTLMQGSLSIIYGLLDKASAIPPQEQSDLQAMLKQDNIIIVQVGDEVDVIPFEWVWAMGAGDGQTARVDSKGFARVFNGDPVLAAKLQMMSQPTFATVLITYFSPIVSGEQARYLFPSQIPPESLTLLAGQMIRRNLDLAVWNMAETLPADYSFTPDGTLVDQEGKPVVLLILPPPPPSDKAGGPTMVSAEDYRRVTSLLDRGVPAVFLTAYLYDREVSFGDQSGPMDVSYAWADYLKAAWGIEALCDLWILSAAQDKTAPTLYTLKREETVYFPLNLFTDHAIGQPLHGQRMLWRDLCPVRPAATIPSGVTVEPVFVIPHQWGNRVWATPHVTEIIKQLNQGRVGTLSPDPATGDLLIPEEGLSLAVAASRAGREAQGLSSAITPGRIAVLGVAGGVTDSFMMSPPVREDEQGRLVVEDPPYANADLIINSLHWVLGQEEHIVATGLARARPIGDLSSTLRMTLWLLCVFVLPALVLGIGVVVMVIRRR